jgi:hypothetical protein
MEALEFTAKYVIIPLITVIITVVWRMYKKLELRMDKLETRTNLNEKDVLEIRIATRKDIEYIKESIDDIKEILTNKKS